MILLHFHKATSEGGEPLEYIVLPEGSDFPEDYYREEFGGEGYEMEMIDTFQTIDWPSSLPTDRHLVDRMSIR